MTHKIYLIKHLDTGMGYVGITGDELAKRWYQHLHDPASAVYKALRSEGHRITMELLEEVNTRAEALIKEQEYIHALRTAQPDGWNRQVKPKRQLKTWDKHIQWLPRLLCPICKSDLVQMRAIEIYKNTVDGDIHAKIDYPGIVVDNDMTNRIRRNDVLFNGVRIEFWCWNCHQPYTDEGYDEEIKVPPYFHLELLNCNDNIYLQTDSYREDKS